MAEPGGPSLPVDDIFSDCEREDDWISLMQGSSTVIAQSQSPKSVGSAAADGKDLPGPAHAAPPLPPPLLPPTASAVDEVILMAAADAMPIDFSDEVVDKNYKLWIDPIKHVLGGVREARGEQLGPVNGFSGCSGLCSEHKPQSLLGIRVVHEWTCDPEPYSYNFIAKNGPVVKHHYSDMFAVARGSCFCFSHARVCEVTQPLEPVHKVLTCGTSCRPFSTARTARMTTSTEHADRDLFSAFLTTMIELDCDEGWLENVMGILLRESRSDPRSPLEKMVQETIQKAPIFHPRLLSEGELFPLFISPACLRTFLPRASRRISNAGSNDKLHRGRT